MEETVIFLCRFLCHHSPLSWFLHPFLTTSCRSSRFDRNMWIEQCQPTRRHVDARHRGRSLYIQRGPPRRSAGDGLRSPGKPLTGGDLRPWEDPLLWVLQERGVDQRGHQRRLVPHRWGSPFSILKQWESASSSLPSAPLYFAQSFYRRYRGDAPWWGPQDHR